MNEFIKKYYKIIIFIQLISFLIIVFGFCELWNKGNYTTKLLNKLGVKNDKTVNGDYYAIVSWQTSLESMKYDADVIFLGDSITRGGDWQDKFPNLKICNIGYSGDTINGLINRLNMVKAVNPEKVFILIGVNDIKMGQSKESYINSYRELLNGLLEYKPTLHIYVESILPTRKPEDLNNDKIIEFNNAIKDMLKSYNDINYIDLYPSFCDKNGELISDYTSGGLHLNSDGYNNFYNCIKEYVK